MTFGEIGVEEAAGAIAAHTIRAAGLVIRKGTSISPDLATALKAAGIRRLVAARLEHGDVGEDDAAAELAAAVAGAGVRIDPPFTGRANLFASSVGVLLVAAAGVDAVNRVDEAITFATLPTFKPVVDGEMVGTVKIIPYSVPRQALRAARAEAPTPLVTVAPYRVRRVGAISTMTPGLKPTIVEKTIGVLRDRLAPTGAEVIADVTCPHETWPLADALATQAAGEAELIVVFGASAIADRRDVIPAAIEAAGGEVIHLGMPVDPGNLLLIGRLAGRPVLGAPGCARSPKENGFDWILHRLLAGLEVSRADVTALGVGGLLMEIVSRGQPRLGGASEDHD